MDGILSVVNRKLLAPEIKSVNFLMPISRNLGLTRPDNSLDRKGVPVEKFCQDLIHI